MNLWKRLIDTRRKLSIITKFTLAFITLILLIGVVALTGFVSLDAVQDETEAAIAGGIKMQGLVFQMDAALKNASRLERDFFLLWPTIGFSSANQDYVEKYRSAIADVLDISSRLQERLKSPDASVAMRQTTPDLRDYRDKVTQYSANFQEAVGLVSQLGIDDVGKIAELKQNSAKLRDRFQLTNASELMVLYLEMQSSEQEYLSTRKESALKSMLNAIQQMETTINLSPKLDEVSRADALQALKAYESVAQEIVQLNQEILSKINKDVDGNSAEVSKKLLNVANAEVTRARLAIAMKIQAARVLLIAALISALIVGLAVAKQFKSALQTLAIEQMKSERLLLNILPAPIAQRLKQEERTIADHFAEVTVLFADIVGFTELAAETSPIELVEILNEIFSVFDELVEKHGLEKIKTIGDAYMVVGGLPTPKPNHAEAIADMALDMQSQITEYSAGTGKELSIRIGINTGPVIAGIIGTKKFIYDLWGDTVNTASRMESHGIPGCVQVTEATYKHLKLQYRFEERGTIKVKGKGPMNCYLLQEKIN